MICPLWSTDWCSRWFECSKIKVVIARHDLQYNSFIMADLLSHTVWPIFVAVFVNVTKVIWTSFYAVHINLSLIELSFYFVSCQICEILTQKKKLLLKTLVLQFNDILVSYWTWKVCGKIIAWRKTDSSEGVAGSNSYRRW